MDEIELKLHLTEAAANRMKAAGVLPGNTKPVAQRSVYFDTPELALSGARLSMRIRKAKGKRIQTVKQAAEGAAGVHSRPEWEIPVTDDAPVLDGFSPAAEALAGQAARLVPLFTVSVARQTWTLDEADARIAVVIDKDEVTAPVRQSRFSECELELLAGPREALFAVARRLGAVAPMKLGVLTKSEPGYRLIGPQLRQSRPRLSRWPGICPQPRPSSGSRCLACGTFA